MNSIDLYFLNKANQKISDEYFEEIQKDDLENIKKAKTKILTIPLLAFSVTYLIKNFRDRMFVSNNFLVNMMSIRSKYSNQQYKSKNYEERKADVDKMANPYQQISQERKAQEEISKSKGIHWRLILSKFLSFYDGL